jgi:hypothetical protein
MGLEQFLTAEDKIQSLLEVKTILEREIFFLCNKYRIDTDSIDIATFSVDSISEPVEIFKQGYLTIQEHCKSLNAVIAKLAELQS